MKYVTQNYSLSDLQTVSPEEATAVAGGKMNQYGDIPRPIHQPIDSGHGAGGYSLPEMEMDTGIIYLHF